jgi:putative CRISPR-associated protein (TIGR02619 family)
MPYRQPSLIISTCGTSILSNGAEPKLRDILRSTANLSRDKLTSEQYQAIEARAADQDEKLQKADAQLVRELSAELNGLFGYYNDCLHGNDQDHHILFHTDTYQGYRTAELIEGYLQSRKLAATRQTFKDLRTDKIEHFHAGIAEMIEWCERTLPGYRDSNYRIVFNLTGGFKSIQGWMQTLGMFYADEIVCIFEYGRELLRIPRIPVAIDEGIRKVVEENLRLFRKLAPSHAVCKLSDLAGIPEVFFFRLGDEAELSPWGRLVWERSRKLIYGVKLHEPTNTDIRFTDKFKKVAEMLGRQRLVILNERIDDICDFYSTRRNPNRLDFKMLRGNPRPPSTHECDAWADMGAWRIFAHYEGNHLVLDDLGEGLH